MLFVLLAGYNVVPMVELVCDLGRCWQGRKCSQLLLYTLAHNVSVASRGLDHVVKGKKDWNDDCGLLDSIVCMKANH